MEIISKVCILDWEVKVHTVLHPECVPLYLLLSNFMNIECSINCFVLDGFAITAFIQFISHDVVQRKLCELHIILRRIRCYELFG